ncbi:hypothetical protein GCM10010909_16570 [Acidocella aquatica]|uniref:Acyl-CoA thioesterase-like N-terminal HotDog domain-containing protein n=1 Tax=Acidocella aquatica TaxID=1922313 RepID=A0ABQ6A5N4_9PROT|nr:PaaI family thioesterase [Acidocella aquatica]GLR66977.1 hypothetical protein GCM10010909_16570 [Acidocella aquatica]
MTGLLHKIRDGELILPGISQTLGCAVLRIGENEDEVECSYQIGPQFLNPAEQVQGGILCAMLDDVTSLLIINAIGPGASIATLNLNTSFIRPGTPGGFRGMAKLVRHGREVCNVTGELWQEGKLIATATAVSKILPVKPRD